MTRDMLQLMDPWVSHRHCEIDQIGDVLVVRDLNSRNGVFIHHYRVGKSELASGDQLIIGRTEVTVRYLGNRKWRLKLRSASRQSRS